LRSVEQGDYYIGNIEYDASQFTKFVIGLSYMFNTDNMGAHFFSDNVFYYTDDELAKINFNNTPATDYKK
jgi:hypothetical protein